MSTSPLPRPTNMPLDRDDGPLWIFFFFFYFSLPFCYSAHPIAIWKRTIIFYSAGMQRERQFAGNNSPAESVGSPMCAHTPRPIRPFTPMVFIDRSIHTRRRAHKEHLNACICIFVMYITHKNWKSLYSRYSSSRHPRPSQFANNRDVYIM